MKTFVALALAATTTLVGCSSGTSGGTGPQADGPSGGQGTGATSGSAGSATSGGTATPCAQATALIDLRCPENVSDRTYAPTCGTRDQCRAQCVLQYPCDAYRSSTCVAACPADTSGGMTSGGMTSGGMTSGGMTSGGMTSGGTSGAPSGPRPECMAYASTYCSCLGSAAAADCVSGQATQCDDYYTLTTTSHEFYDCVTAHKCSAGWLDACTPMK